MTLSVNYRGGFAKLSDLGVLVITRDYVAFLLLQLRLCVYFIFFVPSTPLPPVDRDSSTASAVARLWLTNQILQLHKPFEKGI